MNRNTRTLVRNLAALAGLPLSLAANGTAINWANPAGGAANVGINWNGGVAPGSADAAVFNLAAAYTVTFPLAANSTNSLNVGHGSVTWNMTSPHTTSSLHIATDTVNTPITTLTGGTLDVAASGNAVEIGLFAGAGNGTLTVINGSSLLRASNASGDIVVGVSGTGTLNLTNGGRAESADDIFVGLNAGSHGTVLVQGSGIPNPATLATTSATTGDIIVGDNGTGTLTVQTLGVINSAHDLLIALNAGSTGTVNVQTFGNPGTLLVARNCDIGRNTTAATPAGNGLLSLSGTASATISGITTVGDPDGGTGTLLIDGGTYTTHGLTIDPAHGLLNFRNGTLIVDGGVFTPSGGSLTIDGAAAGNLPTVRLLNGAALTATGILSIANTSSRAARLEVLGASQVSASGISVCGGGAVTAGNGSALVSGVGSSLSCTNSLSVAVRSVGTLDVQAGGHVQCGFGDLGESAGSQGTANIDGAGSRWDATNALGVGGTPTTAGGTGILNITNGGAVSTGADVKVYSSGAVNINNGSLSADADVTESGTLNMTNGTLTAANLVASTTTNIAASGRVDAKISNPSVFTAHLTLNGPLDIGPGGTSGGFSWAGTLAVGGNNLTIRNPQGLTSRLGSVTISGGSITPTTPGRSTVLANGDSLVGAGTINGPMQISAGATITPTGINGLTFNGAVSLLSPSPSLTMTGSQIRFGPTSSFTGAGSINAVVIADPGSVITATGPLTLGADSAFGLTLEGAAMHVGPNHVTIQDANGLSVGFTDITGGNLELTGATSDSAQLSNNGGSLSGFGTVTVAAYRNIGGEVSPGLSGAGGAGLLAFTGDYTQKLPNNQPGTLNIELGGAAPANFDRISAGGGATLGGTLNVTLINGYVPQPGVFHQIVTSGSGFVLGDFFVKHLPPGFAVLFGSNSYSIGIPCVADVDNGEGTGTPDGGVTIDDLLYYLDIFAQGLIQADVDDGSFTGTRDGGVTIDDLLYFLDRFSTGC